MTEQEIKDALWRLDEEVERMTATITEQTGRAWKASVESSYGDWHKLLVQSRVSASRLHDLLYRAETELCEDD